ncbi:NADPH:quinone oxidoreductase family protein [Aquisalimonas lutea]|uniref:NADPH:quinone oxidoreductase family protein n=1 Tax=Aquisalimonas lutea TaxID=1327750 RepID=UPI0025B37BAE|nr:NADPH:quinone oxidoreductase family protein [Aquisalimonas lutea]MDN3518896.1 NADPH:quinone oxidoreductase family protein [Aquisalimonas lutea]
MSSAHYRIIQCRALTGPDALAVAHEPARRPGPGEVRVAVRAAGVNYPDLLMTRGAYQLRLEPPFTPGMEVAGEVLDTGAGVTQVHPGERVIALMRHGGYAEEVVVPEAAVVRLPETFNYEHGAAFHVATRTAWHALVDRAGLARGETLLVLGATGGVGLAAVELASLLGARVIAVGSSDDKLAAARERGAEAVVNYRTQDLQQAVAACGSGVVDVVYDPVGGDLSRASTGLLAPGGRMLIIGFASGDIPAFPADHARQHGYTLLGVRAGEAGRRDPARAREGLQALLAFAGQGHLKPRIHARYPLVRAAEALHALEQRSVVGRIVLIP